MISPIQILPEEILLEIFDYLDHRSINNSSLVCKNWWNAINSSSRIGKRFKLTLDGDDDDNDFWTDKFQEVIELKRKFQAIEVTLDSQNHPQAVELLKQILRQHGNRIKKMILFAGNLQSLNDLYEILNATPQLNELHLNRMTLNALTDRDLTYVMPDTTVKALQKLSVRTSNWHYFALPASSITTLEMTNKFVVIDQQQMAHYLRFLEMADKLESIQFDMICFAKTFRSDLTPRVHFKLRQLRCLLFSLLDEPEIYGNFILFLKSQAQSLKVLELNYAPPAVLTTIFTQLKALEKLRLNSSSLQIPYSFYRHFSSMANLKELILHDVIEIDVPVNGILRNCPNLEVLDARHDEHCIPNILLLVADLCRNIQSLSINKMVSPGARFRQLKFLHIQAVIENTDNLLEFLSNNPTIESLSVMFDTIMSTNEAALLELEHLRHLKVVANESILKDLYEQSQVDDSSIKLKSLELLSASRSDSVLIRFYGSGAKPSIHKKGTLTKINSDQLWFLN